MRSGKKEAIVVGFPESGILAKQISKASGFPYSQIDIKKFPDGETNLRYAVELKGKIVYLVRSFNDPNEKLIELMFASQTARELGAKKVYLIAPYLCYMRQDKRFRPGEAISSRIVANALNLFLDGMITIDPHLHRYKHLNEIFKMKTKRLTAIGPMADFIKKNFKNPFIFGPDEESYQWAESVANLVGCKADVLKKERFSSENVKVKLSDRPDIKGMTAVIVDDIISTGHTIEEVVKIAKKMEPRRIYCMCVHGLYVENALNRLERLGVVVVSTNTVISRTSKIDVSNLIAKEIKK